MYLLRIEHTVLDFEAWKKMFDGDPVDRRGSGVVRYRISRAVDDPNLVTGDLEFTNRDDAEKLHAKLKDLWAGPAAAMTRNPTARVVEVVDEASL
ncbi:hypothetical protein EEB14_16765 [Rhodococcus sp. WS4]|nr:hypothetical protein EEB14_16765 [Rhodococcus sp. WS4]